MTDAFDRRAPLAVEIGFGIGEAVVPDPWPKARHLLAGGPTERYAERPLTRFERRGITAGRSISDLTYRRSSSSAPKRAG